MRVDRLNGDKGKIHVLHDLVADDVWLLECVQYVCTTRLRVLRGFFFLTLAWLGWYDSITGNYKKIFYSADSKGKTKAKVHPAK